MSDRGDPYYEMEYPDIPSRVYAVFESISSWEERLVKNCSSKEEGKESAKRLSKASKNPFIVRGMLEGDELDQAFVLAIYYLGEEVEDE